MKKQFFLISRNLFLLALAALFGWSCQEENLVEPPVNLQSEKLPFEEHLLDLGKAALMLAQEPEFKKTLHKEIEKQFDGEPNVLFETLLEKGIPNINNQMAKGLNIQEDVKASCNAFKNIEGENFYPQVFIPFYEELKQKDHSDAILISEQSDPVVVIFTGDDSQEIFNGYRLNEAGDLVDIGVPVDEEYARNNEVWVISINERVNQSGHLRINARTSEDPYDDYVIDEMRVECHKESWAAGSSEIHIKRFINNHALTSSSGGFLEPDRPRGEKIAEVKRKYIRNDSWLDINFPFVLDWEEDPDRYENPYVYYVIYEYDPYPAGKKNVNVGAPSGNAYVTLTYRSSNGYYYAGYLARWDASDYSIDNDCMAFIINNN